MKKIILLAALLVSSIAMTSCTADPIEEAPVSTSVSADDTGGQSGNIPPPPPPPRGFGG